MFVAVPACIPTLVSARAHLSFSSSSQFVLSNPNHRPLVCRSSLDESKQQGELEQRASRSVLVERYEDGKTKRYVLDTNRHLQSFWEGEESLMNKVHDDDFSNISLLLKKFRYFVLPASFPASVSDDYLDYMLLQFPTNVTGWICHTLVTSSLLKADGLGAIGRLFIGGRYGYLFDDDPRQWRMYADIIGSAGSVFELSTQLYPAYFLPLASLGNLMKAIARGLKDPSFRVIQNHFAISTNLGEVAAKEEVWEVAAQLVGLTLGVLIMVNMFLRDLNLMQLANVYMLLHFLCWLNVMFSVHRCAIFCLFIRKIMQDAPVLRESYYMHAFTWLSMRLLHLWLRYQSLSVLKFRSINLKRARILVKSHVLYNTVPGYIDVNKEEELLAWEHFLQPRITFGVPIEGMIPKDDFSHMVKALLELYVQEKYILFVNRRGSEVLNYYITYKVGATSLSVLKSLWQVYWLHNYHSELGRDDILGWLNESLLKLEARFAIFLKQLEDAGWEKDQIILKVPKHLLFEEADSLPEFFQ